MKQITFIILIIGLFSWCGQATKDAGNKHYVKPQTMPDWATFKLKDTGGVGKKDSSGVRVRIIKAHDSVNAGVVYDTTYESFKDKVIVDSAIDGKGGGGVDWNKFNKQQETYMGDAQPNERATRTSQIDWKVRPTKFIDSFSVPADTIKCLMLVCDTLNTYVTISRDGIMTKVLNDTHTHWQYGYKIMTIGNRYSEHNITIDAKGNVVPDSYSEVIGYLNQDRKPLSKSIVVWQSIEVK